MAVHVVRQGESILSLSKKYGIPVNKIWEHPDNSGLRGMGRKENILFPRDRVQIPERELKQINVSSDQRHRFRSTGHTSELRLHFLKDGESRARMPYVLSIDGTYYRGNLDDDGSLEVRVPVDATLGRISLGEGEDLEHFDVRIGHLDPVEEEQGMQERLYNLGYYSSNDESRMNMGFQEALRQFQEANNLEPSGEVDSATRDKIIELHGS